MISSSQIKFVHSLKQKKFREIHRCFVAEGSKLVLELAGSYLPLKSLYAIEEWASAHPVVSNLPVEVVKPQEMERMTSLSSPSPVLAVVGMPEDETEGTFRKEGLTLMLDGIQDPGNLGTIIRIADWFGIGQVICSEECVDLYNPKVVQATMGSITRVRTTYANLPRFLASLERGIHVYGMMLEGEEPGKVSHSGEGIIVIGSEAHGISGEVASFVTKRISIPFYPVERETHAESLNAAVATGIVCAEFRKT